MTDGIQKRAGNQATLELSDFYKFDFDAGDLLVGGTAISTTLTGAISVLIDGGGVEIADAVKVPFGPLPVAVTITGAYALLDQSGSIVVDVWADSYANYPPSNSESITASAPITVSSAVGSLDTTLTDWDTTLPAGSILYFNVDSCTTATWALITLSITRGVS